LSTINALGIGLALVTAEGLATAGDGNQFDPQNGYCPFGLVICRSGATLMQAVAVRG
jgi:hypothetical protein